MSIHKIFTHYAVFFMVFLLSMMPTDRIGARVTKVSFKKCLKCHPNIEKDLEEEGAHDPFKRLKCSRCHNPHAAKYEGLVKDNIGKLCRNCHQGEHELIAKSYSHSPFKQGACMACHRPHTSNNPKLLVVKTEQLCFECHAEEGSFSRDNKHDPVSKGDCLSCHSPHTSDHETLAKKNRKELCITCHSIKKSTVQEAHFNYPVQGTDCMSCHSPHGSNRSALVKKNLHNPFALDRCRTCHHGLPSKNPLGIKGKGASICIDCHTTTRQDFKKVSSHVGRGMFCVNCHSPHASDGDHLRKAKETRMCFSCHEDTKRQTQDKDNTHKHPLLKEGKCSPCHRPHGSDFRLFFSTDEIKACTACHERHAQFTHPIGENAIDPRSKRSITCITCHNLMGSPNRFALRFSRKRQLCIQCHKGY